MIESAPTRPPVAVPPLLPDARAMPARKSLALLLSLCLAVFLTDAVFSLLDDSLLLFLKSHAFTGMRGVAAFFALVLGLMLYAGMGLTPLIPKRLLLPVAIFTPVILLLQIPGTIWCYSRLQVIGWISSLGQVLVGLAVVYCARRSMRVRWPLVPTERLGDRAFSWRNLLGFAAVNAFILLPGVIIYLCGCASLAVDHYTDGFLRLRPGGFSVQVRKYVRPDGKSIELIPMAHIGDPGFYRKVARSFPTNAVILMEGVTDNQSLLTNHITYKRMATSLGLAEQHEAFEPDRGELVRADVDVAQFSPNTIGLLNMAMFVHARGLNPQTVQLLLRFSPEPGFEKPLMDDLLRKRNDHLLAELQKRLPRKDAFVVPWGVAHMPGIAAEIQRSGFRLQETRDYALIRFRFFGSLTQPDTDHGPTPTR